MLLLDWLAGDVMQRGGQTVCPRPLVLVAQTGLSSSWPAYVSAKAAEMETVGVGFSGSLEHIRIIISG